MPPARMVVNEVDLSTYGLWVETPQGWAGAPARQDNVVQARGAGGFISPDAAVTQPRSWTVDAVLIGSSMADALAKWDTIKLVLANVWLEVIIQPWTDRMLVCRYQGVDAQPRDWKLPGWRMTLNFLAANPYFVSPLVDSYGLNAGEEVRIALGTAASPYLVRFVGPNTTPTLSYLDANGRTRGSLTLSSSLLQDEWLEFDSLAQSMVRRGSLGQVFNGSTYLSNASQLFSIDPMDGTDDEQPVLALDSGAAMVYVRKAWR